MKVREKVRERWRERELRVTPFEKIASPPFSPTIKSSDPLENVKKTEPTSFGLILAERREVGEAGSMSRTS